MSSKVKGQRWDVRVAESEDQEVREAANALGRSYSDFVRMAAVREAERVLADRVNFELETEQWDAFITILERPARSPKGLEDLFSRRSVFDS